MRARELDVVDLVQNPALGASLLWAFGKSFQAEAVGSLCTVPTYFLILPLLYNAKSLGHIQSTFPSSGLSKMVSKFNDSREDLLAIHHRVSAMRQLTLDSIGIGVTTHLLTLDYDRATVRSNAKKLAPIPERLRGQFMGADRLGKWFARLPQGQVFHMLKVEA